MGGAWGRGYELSSLYGVVSYFIRECSIGLVYVVLKNNF